MKVQYTKTYTDKFNHTFEPGWVAEHSDAEGQRRIDAGVCIKVSNEARTFKLKPVQAPALLCVPDEPKEPEQEPETKLGSRHKTHKHKNN